MANTLSLKDQVKLADWIRYDGPAQKNVSRSREKRLH